MLIQQVILKLFNGVFPQEKVKKVEMKKRIKVILDAGHGFNTPGKRSKDGSFRENEFNKAILNKVTLLLDQLSIPYHILVPEWNDISLTNRIRREHKIHKQAVSEGYKPILVSIHANAAPSSRAYGVETFAVSDSGVELANYLHKAILDSYNYPAKPNADRGVKSANFTMLTESLSPACLIECGFMTNKDDLTMLKDDEYRNRLSYHIAEQLNNYNDFYNTER